MFSSRFKKVLAVILIIAMTVTSAGFTTLAGTINSAVSIAEDNSDGRRDEFALRYSKLYSSRLTLLQNNDTDNKLQEGEVTAQDSGGIEEKEEKTDSSDEAGVGAQNSNTDEGKKTTSDDSSSLNEDKKDNDDDGSDTTDPSIKSEDGVQKTSSVSDAEENDDENKKPEDIEEPEENESTTSTTDYKEDDETATESETGSRISEKTNPEDGKWFNSIYFQMYSVDENKVIHDSGNFLADSNKWEYWSKDLTNKMISKINQWTPGYSFAYVDDKTKTNLTYDWGDGRTPVSWRDDDQDSFKIIPVDHVITMLTVYVTKGGFITWDLGEGASWVSGYEPYTSYSQGVGRDSLPSRDLINAPEGLTFSHWTLNDERINSISSTQTGNITLKANYINVSSLWNTGDYVYYGTYQQSSTVESAVEPIRWVVASVNEVNNEVLLLSEKALDIKKYFDDATSAARWDFSPLRDALNEGEDSFYNKAFNEQEKAGILEKDIDCLSMNEDQTTVSKIKTDKNYVFILDTDDINELKANGFDLSVYPTAYAKSHSNKSYVRASADWDDINPINDEGKTAWWTRRGKTGSAMEFIVDNDSDNSIVSKFVHNIYGVRPAMWVDAVGLAITAKESAITWELGNGEWLDDSTWESVSSYKEGVGLTLPTTENFKDNGAYMVDGWFINGDTSATYSEIPSTQTGDITLTANWQKIMGRQNIIWDLDGGSWVDGYVATTSYMEGQKLELPTFENVKKSGVVLYGWTINDGTEVVSEIPETQLEEVTLKASWGNPISINIRYVTPSGKFGQYVNLSNVQGNYVAACTSWSYDYNLTLSIPTTYLNQYDIANLAVKNLQGRHDIVKDGETNCDIGVQYIEPMNVAAFAPELFWSIENSNKETTINAKSDSTPLVFVNVKYKNGYYKINKNEYIYFGRYPQSVVNYNVVEPIKWRVLSVDDTEAYLVADKVLDANNLEKRWTQGCQLRSWLNGTFKDKAFNEEEQDALVPITMSKTENDMVSILSKEDINNATYFYNNNLFRKPSFTAYAESVNPNGGYWVRGGEDSQAIKVNSDGSIIESDFDWAYKCGVLPTIKINLLAPIFANKESKITWNTNGGEWASGSTWYYLPSYREGVALTLPTVDNFKERKSYIFDGWFINDDRTATYSEIPSTQTGNVTLTANWIKIYGPRKINWDLDGGSWAAGYVASTSYVEGQKLVLPTYENVKKSGAALSGWTINGKTEIVREIPETQIDEITLKASWTTPISINVRYVRPSGKFGQYVNLSNVQGNYEVACTSWHYDYDLTLSIPITYLNQYDIASLAVKNLREGYNIAKDEESQFDIGIQYLKPMNNAAFTPELFWTIENSSKTVTIDADTSTTPIVFVNVKRILPEYIWMGVYPQNDEAGTQLEPIKWRVLSSEEDEVLLLADNILDNVSYQRTSGSISWAGSGIRAWLNNTFKTKAFTQIQINSGIVDKTLTSSDSENTQDKVFLLDNTQAESMGSNAERQAKGTVFAKGPNSVNHNLFASGGYSGWWLRLPNNFQDYANCVYANGQINSISASVAGYGVRPAIYADMSFDGFKYINNKVTWNLGDSSFNDNSKLWLDYDAYQGGQELPNNDNMISGNDYVLNGWFINDDRTATYSYIPSTQTGDITLTPNWIEYYDGFQPIPAPHINPLPSDPTKPIEADMSYGITWELDGGNFVTGYTASTSYVVGKKKNLPTNADVVKNEYILSGWFINDDRTATYSEIPSTQTGEITLTPNWIENGKNNEDNISLPEYIWMGVYPQNDEAGTQLEPIKWKVLSNDENEVLLLADSVLDNVSYHAAGGSITWAGSSIRTWLNDTFKPKAFTKIQIDSGIVDKTLTTDGSVDTNDKVFLLDVTQAQNMGSDANRMAYGTAFAKGPNSVDHSLSVGESGESYWWLRSTGLYQDFAAIVGDDGYLYTGGRIVFNHDYGVRPALYADMNFAGFKSNNNSVTWNLGTSRFATNSQLWLDYDAYQGGQQLPNNDNMISRDGYVLDGWFINDDRTATYSEIPSTQTGDITLTPNWIENSKINDENNISLPEYIWMGVYPQNDESGTQLEPIKWKVLSHDGNEALLLADNILDNYSYEESGNDVSWADSAIRKWINNSFKPKAFTDIQINSGIVDKKLSTDGSVDTNDKVFLLDETQARNMGNNANRQVKGTAFAKGANSAMGNIRALYLDSNGNSMWWLRTHGYGKSLALCVLESGFINTTGSAVFNKGTGVRPAIYANMKFAGLRASNNSVTWNLGTSRFATNSELWLDYDSYQGGQQLPNNDNMVEREGYTFDGWFINDDRTATYSEIPSTQTGDITLTPNWIGSNASSDDESSKSLPEYIWMGVYPQNDESGTQLEPIKWRVLSSDNNEALLLSENILDNVSYHDSAESVTWAYSSIRAWLNGAFKSKAFTKIQIDSGIVDKTIKTTGSDDTQDKVFLLDTTQAQNMGGDANRKAVGTAFAKGSNSVNKKLDVNDGYSYWWLRSPGYSQSFAADVTIGGYIFTDGSYVDTYDTGVRPALYADMNFAGFKSNNNSVTWNLGDSSFNDNSKLWLDFDAYQGGQQLPYKNNMLPKDGYKFKGWHINGGTDIYTSIPETQTGNITLSPVWEKITVPQHIWMGVYPQNDEAGTQLEPIKWKVLSHDGDEALLLADSVLDNVSYHAAGGSITWAGSSIRTWLNDTFKSKAFTKIQIDSGIVDKTIKTTGSDDTQDKVFLLDTTQAQNMGSDANRRAVGTAFAKGANSVNKKLDVNDGYSYWWLRSPGHNQGNAADVNDDGYLYTYGNFVDLYNGGVRPALYADMSFGGFKSSNNSVTWNLGDSSFNDNSKLWLDFDAYQGGQQLPNNDNMISENDYVLNGWFINDDRTATYSYIPSTQTGDITLTPNWIEYYDGFQPIPAPHINPLPSDPTKPIEADMSYGITWELDGGNFVTGYTASTSYVVGKKKNLPTNVDVVKNEYILSGWFINDDRTATYSEIPATQTGDITLTANWISSNASSDDESSKTVPEYIWMGVYPQNDKVGTQLEPIKWRVLSNDNNEALLLAENILNCVSFHTKEEEMSWAGSSIRTWLNDKFKSKAFTQIQIDSGIVEKFIYTDGQATRDRVFLLDDTEAENMGSDTNRMAYGTAFAKGPNSVNGHLQTRANGNSFWWLRSKGSDLSHADCVHDTGDIFRLGYFVYTHDFGVRPAIYANMSFDGFKYNNNSVTWNLGISRFATNSQLWLDYDAYQGGQQLPNNDNMVSREGYKLDGWFINDDRTATYSEIPATQTGNITLTPNWIEAEQNTPSDPSDPSSPSTPSEPSNPSDPSSPSTPSEPSNPSDPSAPSTPSEPSNPSDPSDPSSPSTPSEPSDPSSPSTPSEAISPTTPSEPSDPSNPSAPSAPSTPSEPSDPSNPSSPSTPSEPSAPSTPSEQKKGIEVGDYVIFGTYPQSTIDENIVEDIEWKVLAQDGSKSLLISRYVLDAGKFHGEYVSDELNWENAKLREWLNYTFYNKAFNTDEQTHVRDTEVNNRGRGNNTTDKVFLLSKEELETYFTSNADRVTSATVYADSIGETLLVNALNGKAEYWTRTLVGSGTSVRCRQVLTGGSIDSGYSVGYAQNMKLGYRPAAWVDTAVLRLAPITSKITWKLGDAAAWRLGYTASPSYVEGRTYVLPTNDNVFKSKHILDGWFINDDRTATYSVIPATQTGDITLTANWINPNAAAEDYYTLSHTWMKIGDTDTCVDTEILKNIKTITFSRYPEPSPVNARFTWDVHASRGLTGYVVNDEIIIYAPENKKIFVEPTGKYLFTGLVIPSEDDPDADVNVFRKVEAINNFNIVDTSKATDMSYMFNGLESLKRVDLSNMDTSNVTDMSNMFTADYALEELDLSSFNTSKVENMQLMFNGCRSLKTLDLSNFDTSRVTNMLAMFGGCNGLEELNVTSFNTKNVTNMASMFVFLKNIKTLNLSSFDTSKVTTMKRMFVELDNLEDILVDPAKWTVAKVTESSEMFKDCPKLTGRFGSRYTNVVVTGDDHGFGQKDKEFARVDGGWNSTTPGYLCDATVARVPAFWRNNKDAYVANSWNIDTNSVEKSLAFAPGWYEELGFTTSKENITKIALVDGKLVEDGATEVKYVNEYVGNDVVATYSFIIKGTELYVSNAYDAENNLYANSYIFGTNIEDVSNMFAGFTNLETIYDKSETYREDQNYTGTYIHMNTKYARNLFKDCHKLTFTNMGLNKASHDLIDVEGMFENCYAITNDTIRNYFKFMNSVDGKSTKFVNVKNMFKNCRALTSLNLTKFDTSNTTDMTSMFEGCSNLATIMASSKFVTTKVTASENMFNACQVLSGSEGTAYAEYGNRDASFAVIDKGEARRGYLSEFAYVLNKGWFSVEKSQVQPSDVNKIRFASSSAVIPSYEKTWAIEEGLNAYLVSLGSTPAGYEVIIKGDEDAKIYAPVDSSYLFSYLHDANGNKLEDNGFNNVTAILNIEYLETRRVATASHMFDNMANLATLDLSKNVWTSLRDTSYMFNNNNLLETLNISSFDTKNVTNMEYMFNSCSRLKAIDVTNFNTSKVTNMKNMFYNVKAIKELNVSNFNTEKVTNMSGMFYGIGNSYVGTNDHIELDLSNFNTSNVTNMSAMFSDANTETLDLSSFDTSKVTSMSGMFAANGTLHTLTLGDNFNTGNVADMSSMFMFTKVMSDIDFTRFDTSRALNMSNMFAYSQVATEFTLDLTSFDTSNVSNMAQMFKDNTQLTRIRAGVGFDTSRVTNSVGMFDNCTSLKGSFGTTIASTSYVVDKTYARVDGGVKAMGYFSGEKHIITFDAKNGYFPSLSTSTNKVRIATVSAYSGELLSEIKPEDPVSYSGRDFSGWRTSDGSLAGEQLVFESDIVLTASYQSNISYKIKLDTGVGSFANGDTERIVYMPQGADTGRFEIPSAVGYVFDDYYVEDEVLRATLSYATDDEIKVEAKYIPNNYGIVFNGNGATSGIMAMEIATYGEIHRLSPNQFANDGYDFNGWSYIDEEGEQILLDEAEVLNLTPVKDGIVKLNAVWEPKQTKIYYKGNGATKLLTDSEWEATFGSDNANNENNDKENPEKVSEGSSLFGISAKTEMEATEISYNSDEYLRANRYYRPGYDFEGWALSPDTAAVYFDRSMIGKDENYQSEMTLYAKWKPKKEVVAKLILEGNGGKINGANKSVINLAWGEYLPQVSIERPGYELDYWEQTYYLMGLIAITNKVKFPTVCNFIGEHTIVAHWKPVNYTIRLNENFGDNVYYDVEAEYGKNTNIEYYTAAMVLKRTDARFAGWAFEPNATEGSSVTQLDTSSQNIKKGEILNVYAVWSKPRYTITLHGIDPTKPIDAEDNTYVKMFDYEAGQKLEGIRQTIATFNNVLGEFVGWTYEPYLSYGDDTLYPDACVADRIYEDVLEKDVHFPGDLQNYKLIELWPKWTRKENSSYIIFDGNGGTIEGRKVKTYTYIAGKMIQAPDLKDVYRKGYEIDTMNPWVDKDGKLFTETLAKPEGEIHLYANWMQKTYDIEYVGVGDETILTTGQTGVNSVRETMQGGEDVTIPSNDKFERPGYDFLGWDTSVEANTVVYEPGQVVEALGNAHETVKLYTVWQPRSYTIYYYDGEENLIGTNSFIFTRKVRALPNEGITESTQDAGFNYEVNGEVKKFSSGQSLNAEDFEIVQVEKTVILNNLSNKSNAEHSGLFGGSDNHGKVRERSPLLGDSPLFGDPSTGGGIVLKGDVAKQIYNLTFDANGGLFPDGETVKTATASNGDDMSIKLPANPLPDPTNPNTTGGFIGWAIERDDGSLVEWTDSTYTLSESITFKAKWDIGFTARLMANGGKFADGSDTQDVTIIRNENTNKFEIPAREGYDFVGYFVQAVHGEEELASTWTYFANETTNVVAKWKPYKYKVAYEANTGVGYMGYETATYNEAYYMANNRFTKDGYSFAGWNVNGAIYGEGSEQYNLTNVKNGTVVARATWTPLTYDIEYYPNGGQGNMSDEIGLIYGASHKLAPNAFTYDDHTFRGWALATNAEVSYYDNATLSTTAHYQPVIKLYASWIDNNEIYGTLKLNGNGGYINGSNNVEVSLRFHEAIVEPVLEKTGYKFTNWTDKSGNIYDDGNGNNFPQICDFTELELTANWEPIKYSVRFFTNGGKFTDGTDDFKDITNVEYDNQFNLIAATEISKTRYTFGGWKYTGLAGDTIYAAGAPMSNLSSVDGTRVDLYAVWTGDNYTITQYQLDPSGASLAANSVTNYTYGGGKLIDSINKKIATVSGIAYEFSGWAVPSDRNNIKYLSLQKADEIYENENITNIELYPVWVRSDKLVYITFDGNGGLINGASRWTVPFATGSNLVYPTNVVRKGYIHNGWLDDDKTTPYTETVVGNDDKIIFANWNPGMYNIEFIAVGDNIDNTMAVQSNIPTNVKTTLNTNSYERLGYTFLGWDTNPEAKIAIYADGATDLEPLGDNGETVKLYTVWGANNYIVTYKDYDGNVIGTNTLTYGNTVTVLSNTNIPIGYKDTGFELGGHSGVKFNGGQTVNAADLMITKNTNLTTGVVLNGTVEKIVYIITFNANGGKFPDGRTVASASITYGDPVAPTVPGNPTLAMKTFTGYTVDGAYRDVTTLNYDYLSSKTFFADWDGKIFKIRYEKNAPVSPDTTKTNVVNGATMATQSALANRKTKINSNTYNVTGYNFVGWATESYAAKVVEQMRDNNDSRIIGNAGDVNWDRAEGEVVTLYAMWARNKYQVTFKQNETTGNVADPYVGQFDIYYDEVLSDNPAFASKLRNHYTFTGKFTRMQIANPYARKTFNGTDYFDASSVYRTTAGVTLYPLWLNDEVVINLDLDPDEAIMPIGYNNTSFIGYVDAPLNIIGAAGEPKTANGALVTPIATPYEVYKFNYWSRVKGDDTTKINEQDIYDGTYNTIYANVRLREEYALTYDPNGGQGYMPAKTMKEGIKIKTDINKFTKDGYEFTGWTDQKGNLHGNGFTVDNPSGALALKANWRKPFKGSSGPSGGGGGGGAGIPAGSKMSNLGDGFSLQTMVPVTDYVFTRDSLGLPTGVLLKTSSALAKALMSDSVYSSRYKVLAGNKDSVLIKNGFYNLQRADGNFFYGFDADGKLLTGFVTADKLLLHAMDPTSGKLIKYAEALGGKYYLLDEASSNRGILYALPITIGGIKYLFDETGRVIQELKENPANTALVSNNAEFKTENGWKYDPVNDNWSYYTVDKEGKVNNYKDGVYAIEAPDKNTYYYIFDDKGVMKTGLSNYNGKTYYLRETGDLRGSVYTGAITLNNKTYMFDDSGVMITADSGVVALSNTEPVETGANRFIS